MNPKIKQRIEQIRQGEVPEGYTQSKYGIYPINWDVKKLGHYIKEYKELSNDIQTFPVYSSTRKGLMRQSEYYEQKEASETNMGYRIVPCNYVTYRHMSDDDIFHFNINNTGSKILVSSEYPVFNLTNEAALGFLIPILNYSVHFRYFCRTQKQGGTRTRLYFKNLSQYHIPFPPLPEQQKIADVLTTQDRVIELKEQLLAQKQQQKKYLMQQLLTGKKRLPGFSGEWETVKLSEVVSERKQKNIQQNLRICSVAVQKGVVDQIEHLGRSYASSDTSNYSVAYYGDIIYTKSPTGNFPYGIVKQNLLQESIAVSPLYGVFSSMTFGLGYFLHTYFQSPVYARNYLLPIIQKGAKNTINITNETFISNNLYLPLDEREQNAIANIFITADREIDLLRQNIEAEKQKKKALMQLLLTGIVRVPV